MITDTGHIKTCSPDETGTIQLNGFQVVLIFGVWWIWNIYDYGWVEELVPFHLIL